MAACVIFQDLTLGHNSHPAVHHLDGIVRPGNHLSACTIYFFPSLPGRAAARHVSGTSPIEPLEQKELIECPGR